MAEDGPQPVLTEDGSHSLQVAAQECYHSRFGAATESMWVCVQTPDLMQRMPASEVFRVAEIGFGSGLNFRAVASAARACQTPLQYCGIELLPPPWSLVAPMQTGPLRRDERDDSLLAEVLTQTTACRRACDNLIDLTLYQSDASTHRLPDASVDHLIMDAFSPATAPTLWQACALARYCRWLKPGASFASYCVKGDVKRALRACGMVVTTPPGPPGKREILLAWRRA